MHGEACMHMYAHVLRQTHFINSGFCLCHKFKTQKFKAAHRCIYNPHPSHTRPQVCRSTSLCLLVNILLFFLVVFSCALLPLDPDVFSLILLEWQPLYLPHFTPLLALALSCQASVSYEKSFCPVCHKKRCFYLLCYDSCLKLLSYCLPPWANKASVCLCHKYPPPLFALSLFPSCYLFFPLSFHFLCSFVPNY